MPTVTQPPVNEQILTQQRKHWINVAPVMLSTLILLLVLPLASYLYSRYNDQISKIIPAAAMGSLMLIYAVLVILIALLALWIYGQNRLVLTNHHIVEYTRRGIFNRTESQFSLIKLQDVSCSQNGFLANLLGYGDITIETAGEEENFVFRQVPRPQSLANQIMQAHEALADTNPAVANQV